MTTSEEAASKGNWQARLDNYITSKATPSNIEAIRESCPFQLLTHGVIGLGFGAFLGLFMASVSTSAPEYTLQVPPVPNGISTNGLTLARSQAKAIIKDMAKRTWSSAKSFGKIAALYSGSECVIESVRRDAFEGGKT
jgi:mitochondrial import inner membrane translocase subunit TIM22